MTIVYFILIVICYTSTDVFGDQTWPKLFERDQRPLAVDGSWSSWKEWSPCYNNTNVHPFFYAPWENFMVQSRNRTCTEPTPLAGGKECKLPSHRFRQCSCKNPLGLGNGRIKDKQISASSFLDDYSPSQARLSNGFVGWCAIARSSYLHKPFLQIDFDTFATVGAISMLGNNKGRVKQFKLEYSLNGRVWKNIYSDKDQRNDRFRGNLLPGKVKTNSFDSHKVMKYLRVIPTNTFQLPCFSMELYGCIFSCGELLTNSFGQIAARSSAEFDQSCLWRIEVLNTTSLSFDFNVFYVMCDQGYLDFHDGTYSFTDAPLLSRKCLISEDEEIPILKLPTNKVWVNFVSNSSSSEVGFNIQYFSECNQEIQLVSGKEYEIISPNYPEKYLDNLKCLWTVTSPNGLKEITVTTNDFSVESNRNSTDYCLGDVVIFEKKTFTSKENLGSYCNNHKPKDNFVIKSQQILISFTSDLVASEKGFKFTLLSGEKRIQTTQSSNGRNNNPRTTERRFSSSGVLLPTTNNTDSGGKEQIKKEDEDDTWTIIIICVFSAFAIVLLVWILGMNIRRFMSNRSDLEAHCAKIREDEKKKKKQEKIKLLNEEYAKPNEIVAKPESPRNVTLPGERLSLLVNAPEDNVTTVESVNTLQPADTIIPHNSNENIENVISENQTDVDGDRTSFDSSSPQIHSPLLKTNEKYINIEDKDNPEDEEYIPNIENMETLDTMDESVL